MENNGLCTYFTFFSQRFRFAKQNDLPLLEYCTLPRTGALEVILDVLGGRAKNGAMNNGFNSHSSNITKICDVTIAYPNGKPLDLIQIAAGYREPCVTHVHYRVFDVKDVSSQNIVFYVKIQFLF